MKKKLLLAALIAAMAFVLCGCANQEIETKIVNLDSCSFEIPENWNDTSNPNYITKEYTPFDGEYGTISVSSLSEEYYDSIIGDDGFPTIDESEFKYEDPSYTTINNNQVKVQNYSSNDGNKKMSSIRFYDSKDNLISIYVALDSNKWDEYQGYVQQIPDTLKIS